MKWNLRTITLITGLLFGINLHAQSNKFRIDKIPAWATINTTDYNNDRLDSEAENGYLDVVYEKQVFLEQQSILYKKGIKILSEAGVQNASEISIGFDPTYEQLVLHSIKILRDNVWIDKLHPRKIKIIQQETELDRHIYNQSLSAILFLEDVRKGDVIEYSYTLKGFNTIFKGKYADSYGIAFSVPVSNIYYKIVVPAGRTIIIKNTGTDIKPTIQNLGNQTGYEWRLENVSPVRVQDNLPGWYDPYPAIALSEYTSWKEINDWALALFPSVQITSARLHQKIMDIGKQDTSTQKRILNCLRFIQDEVRYMGFEIGENSHKPLHPEKVFAQRFGDCKDKTYLFCTMLRHMGIEANPVLINSGYKKIIKSWLPSPTAFDHVIAQVKIDDAFLYFDPTIPYQRGNLTSISFPNYQCGLVINKNTTDLVNIPMNEKGMVRVKEIFDIPDMDGRATLHVVTVYSGSFADDIRYSFRNNSNYEMLKKFRDYYAAYFENIKGDSLAVDDNEENGNFTTREYYSISGIWKIEGVKKTAVFEPFVIYGVLKKPKEIARQMPFSISFPAWYKEDIHVNLPAEWNARENSKEISCNNFFMKYHYSYSNRKISLKYEYKTYKDNVTPEEASNYMEKYDKMNKSMAYELTWTDNVEKQFDVQEILKPKNYAILAIAAVVFLVIGFIILRILIKG